MKRNQLKHPHPRKTERYRTCLHESGHATAAALCGVASCAFVFRDGSGLCRTARLIDDLKLDALCKAAGKAAEFWFFGVPRGRWRGHRGPRDIQERPSKSDGDQLATLIRIAELEVAVGERPAGNRLDPEDIEDEAAEFVGRNVAPIIHLAKQLYFRGYVAVPAACPTMRIEK